MNTDVQNKWSFYPENIQLKLLYLRHLIFDVAKNTEGVGRLEETLKWGEAAYLTSQTKSGTTIRIDWKPKSPERYTMYLNCKTSLVDSYRTLFPELDYEGHRAIHLSINELVPEEQLRICIRMALKYHLEKIK